MDLADLDPRQLSLTYASRAVEALTREDLRDIAFIVLKMMACGPHKSEHAFQKIRTPETERDAVSETIDRLDHSK